MLECGHTQLNEDCARYWLRGYEVHDLFFFLSLLFICCMGVGGWLLLLLRCFEDLPWLLLLGLVELAFDGGGMGRRLRDSRVGQLS